MDRKTFSIGDAVSFGWQTLKENLGFLVLVTLIMLLAAAIFQGPQSAFSFYHSYGAYVAMMILTLLGIAVSMFITIATVKIGLRYCDSQKADYPDLVEGYSKFWDILLGSILYGLLVFAGFILLIIPGIYWAVRYHFFPYLIVDRDMGPVEAIKKSGQMTRGVWWNLFLFWLAVFGINLVGAILCGVGLLFTVPWTFVAIAYVYRTLLAETPAAQVTEAPAVPPESPPVDNPPAETV
jgi:Protein of unknown function (DUF975)